ncbi:MAG: hypothetical protein HYR56_25085 [Acidobacteria bacterium]|nr:hypothetical protein [Acidobacteriota bacterium]MBI3421842.1 hypothetical protein [Acidobacteriota bacterium]
MTKTQVLLTAAGVIVTLIVAVWGITAGYMNRLIDQTERNTTRLIEQFEKRMNENAGQLEKRMSERDEKLVAKIDGLRNEMLARFETVQHQLEELQRQNTQRALIEKDVVTLTAKVEMLERRAA